MIFRKNPRENAGLLCTLYCGILTEFCLYVNVRPLMPINKCTGWLFRLLNKCSGLLVQ